MRVFFSCVLLTASMVSAQNPTAPASNPVVPVGPTNSIPAQPNQAPGAYKIGGAVSAPVPTTKPGPEYDPSARERGVQGEVLIAMTVDADGLPQNMRVVKSLDAGLDAKALESVAKWRFKPGMKDGLPVPVQATIAVSFRLADSPPDIRR